MKEFLSLVVELMNQWQLHGKYFTDTIKHMKENYNKLSNHEKKESLSILDELLQEDVYSYFFIMSMLLEVLKEEQIVFYIEKMLNSDKVSVWERIRIMYQLKAVLFSSVIIKNQWQEIQNEKVIYEKILKDIIIGLPREYSYIPWKKREKKIIIVVNQILNLFHAPTRKLISIYQYFKELGYEVRIYVCFYSGETDVKEQFWYKWGIYYNYIKVTTPFTLNIGDEEKIVGYNFLLEPKDYMQEIKKTMDLIYEERPEFVFELGDRTILAGLCHSFTTVVTMGCTKQIPITNASVIARYFEYSEEEEKLYQQCVEDTQIVIDVKHMDKTFQNSDEDAKREKKRQELEIKQEQFVLVIAGNRLNEELSEEFLRILHCILEQNKKFILLLIGNMKKALKEKISSSSDMEQIRFLGYREDFQEVISAGDLFLNPPRQGGGTGAIYAGLEGIPVITLDHCDVESFAGKEFICQSIEEMPSLVWKYYSDKEFYQKQREIIKGNINKLLAVDSIGNFKKLCNCIEKFTLEKEKENET